MRRLILSQIMEGMVIAFAAWWTLSIERGEKPAAILWLWLLRRLHAITSFFSRCVIAVEIAYYRAVTT